MNDDYASDWTDTGVLKVVKAHGQSNDRCVRTVLVNVFGPETVNSPCKDQEPRVTLTPTR